MCGFIDVLTVQVTNKKEYWSGSSVTDDIVETIRSSKYIFISYEDYSFFKKY